MKIVYITFDDLSQNFAWTIHVTEIIKELTKRGHRIMLLLPYSDKRPGLDCDFKFFEPRKTDIGLFLRTVRSFKPDVIYMRGIHISLRPLFVKFVTGIPLVIEINGLIEDVVTRRLMKNVFGILVPLYLRYSDGCVTVSELFGKALRKKGARNVYVVGNGVDTNRFRPLNKQAARRQLNLDGKIGCFIGSFYPHHYLELLVEASKKRNLETRFVMVGDGPQKSLIQKLTEGMPNFVFKGQVSHDLVPLYIATSDFGILILKRMYKYYSPSPIKLYEYMACARPVVLATDIKELRDFVRERNVGLECGLDPDALATAICEIESKTEKFSSNASNAAADFTWANSARKLEEALCHISQ